MASGRTTNRTSRRICPCSTETVPRIARQPASTKALRPPLRRAISFELPHHACQGSETASGQIVAQRDRLKTNAADRVEVRRQPKREIGLGRPGCKPIDDPRSDARRRNRGRRNQHLLCRVGCESAIYGDKRDATESRYFESPTDIERVSAERRGLSHIMREFRLDRGRFPSDGQRDALSVSNGRIARGLATRDEVTETRPAEDHPSDRVSVEPIERRIAVKPLKIA